MKQKTKIIQREVDYLKNAQPRFVSLVDHGANQTPFAVIKHLKGDKQMPTAKKRLKLIRKGERLSGVRKLTFKKSQFKTKDAVTKYLSENDWDDNYEITSKGSLWVVAVPGVTDAMFKSVRSVEVDDGIAAFVGEATAKAAKDADIEDDEEEDEDEDETSSDEDDDNEDDDEDEEEKSASSKKQERVCKFDFWNAYMSKGTSLTEVLKDGMSDDVPPGFESIMQSVMVSVANALSSEGSKKQKKSLIEKIGGEFSDVVYKIYDVWTEALDLETKNSNQKKFINNIQKFIDENKSDDKVTSKSAVDKELLAVLKGLSVNVEKMAERLDSVEQMAEEANEKVSKYSKKSSTRKSLDVDANDEAVSRSRKLSEKEAKAEADWEARLSADMLGIGFGPMSARH